LGANALSAGGVRRNGSASAIGCECSGAHRIFEIVGAQAGRKQDRLAQYAEALQNLRSAAERGQVHTRHWFSDEARPAGPATRLRDIMSRIIGRSSRILTHLRQLLTWLFNASAAKCIDRRKESPGPQASRRAPVACARSAAAA
jgi:hypothetical protein